MSEHLECYFESHSRKQGEVVCKACGAVVAQARRRDHAEHHARTHPEELARLRPNPSGHELVVHLLDGRALS